jgi:hypothetical protein
MSNRKFSTLLTYLQKVPSITDGIGTGETDSGLWWVKFRIDIEHPLTWHVIQEIAHVVNYLSLHEKLPTTFYPVSPPPYLNGSPKEYLSWIIESTSTDFTPNSLKKWLEGRLPRPVEDLEEWKMEE